MKKSGRLYDCIKQRNTAPLGFTIVEIIIVVGVIAILAAVTIIGYNGLQNRARASQVNAGLSQATKELDAYKAGTGAYPTTGNLADADVTNGDVSYQYTSADGSSYCLTGTVGTVSYYVYSTALANVAQGGCPGHSQGGVAAITNVVSNPNFETNFNGTGGYYSSPVTLDTTHAAYGSASVSTTTNSTTNPQGLISNVSSSSGPGITYTCSVSYRGTAGTSVVYSGRAATSGGSYNGEGFGAKTLTLSDSWQRTYITFTTPANTGIVYIQIKLPSAQTGITIAIDGLMCTESSTTYNYADGSSTNWIWNGTANASTSTGPPL